MFKKMKQSVCEMKFGLLTTCFLAILFNPLVVMSADEVLPISIAVVNVTYLMENSPEAELASQKLREQFAPKERALALEQDVITQLETVRERNLSVWSEDEVRRAEREIRGLKRERARTLEDFREELRFARDSALDEVQKSVFLAIEEVRLERGIDIIIQEYVAASTRVNLTPFVITYLQDKLKQQQPSNSEKNNKTE
jgi:outer membrane protein